MDHKHTATRHSHVAQSMLPVVAVGLNNYVIWRRLLILWRSCARYIQKPSKSESPDILVITLVPSTWIYGTCLWLGQRHLGHIWTTSWSLYFFCRQLILQFVFISAFKAAVLNLGVANPMGSFGFLLGGNEWVTAGRRKFRKIFWASAWAS